MIMKDFERGFKSGIGGYFCFKELKRRNFVAKAI